MAPSLVLHGSEAITEVKEWIPRPLGHRRKLTPNPPPYVHPRILFTSADKAELVDRALGECSNAGRAAFTKVQEWVRQTVYGSESVEEAPVRRLLEVLACGETAPGAPGPVKGRQAKSASAVYEDLCDLVTEGVDPPRVLQGSFYAALFRKNLAPVALNSCFGILPGQGRIVREGETDTTTELGVKFLFATSEGGIPTLVSPIYRSLKEAAYVAWVLEEPDRLAWLAAGLAMAARVHLLWYPVPPDRLTKHCGGPAGWGKEDDSVCQHLALAYDLLYPTMSEGQRVWPRRLLLTMGHRRVLTGFNSWSYIRGAPNPGLSHLYTAGTFQVMTSVLLLVQYAVEGESVEVELSLSGKEYPKLEYDAEAAHLNLLGVKFWLTHGTACDPTGTSREAPGYFGTAMRFGSFPTLAAARRLPGVVAESNFYAVLSEILQTSVKIRDGTMCVGSHDGGGYCGGFGQSEYYLIVKYLFPEDPLADYVYQKINTTWKGVISLRGVDKMDFQTALFGLQVRQTPLPMQDLALQVPLPLSFFSNFRGMCTARSSWDEDTGALLYFECRPDMYALGHGHSNRNDFYFASHGRLWVSGGQYHNTENEAHSTVLIDGVGQGGGHTGRCVPKFSLLWSHIPGRVIETLNSPQFTSFCGDAKMAYTYVGNGTQNPGPKGPPKTPVPVPVPWKAFFHHPCTFGPQLVQDVESKQPRWVEDNSWADFHPWAAGIFNPVAFAFRTACLVRGEHSYALIVDDIRKDDDEEHTFKWVANTEMPYWGNGYSQPLCLVDSPEYAVDGVSEAVFVRGEDVEPSTGMPRAGCPLLLLRVVHAAGTPVGPVRIVKVDKVPGQVDHATCFAYHRLELSRAKCTEPGFKVLLFAFLQGEKLPRTTYDPGEGKMVLECGQNQRDTVLFRKEGHRTRVTLL